MFSFLKVFEDVYLPSKPKLQKTLNDLNYFFAFIFALEFVLKIIGLGIVRYFASFWNCLDSLIVAVSNFHFVTWLINEHLKRELEFLSVFWLLPNFVHRVSGFGNPRWRRDEVDA